MIIYDLAIIGSGVAGAVAAVRLTEKSPQTKTIIIDRGRPPGKRRLQLEGWLGSFPFGDGKIYLNDLDQFKKFNISEKKLNKISDWLENLFVEADCPIKISKNNKVANQLAKKIQQQNFEISYLKYKSWIPEQIHQFGKYLLQTLEQNKNLHWLSDTQVVKVIKNKDIFSIEIDNDNNSNITTKIYAKSIVIAMGRSGWRIAHQFCQDLGLKLNNDKTTFGIFVEMPSDNNEGLKDFNKSHCLLNAKNIELTLGPISWGGTVIPEDHEDLTLTSFRSNENRWKSDKVSFKIIQTINNKFNCGLEEAERLGKLPFVLGNDRVTKEKIKLIEKKQSVLSQLPEYQWLIKTLKEIELFFPNLISKASCYFPCVKTSYSTIDFNNNFETTLENFWLVGESAGIEGIYGAMISGVLAIDSYLSLHK